MGRQRRGPRTSPTGGSGARPRAQSPPSLPVGAAAARAPQAAHGVRTALERPEIRSPLPPSSPWPPSPTWAGLAESSANADKQKRSRGEGVKRPTIPLLFGGANESAFESALEGLPQSPGGGGGTVAGAAATGADGSTAVAAAGSPPRASPAPSVSTGPRTRHARGEHPGAKPRVRLQGGSQKKDGDGDVRQPLADGGAPALSPEAGQDSEGTENERAENEAAGDPVNDAPAGSGGASRDRSLPAEVASPPLQRSQVNSASALPSGSAVSSNAVSGVAVSGNAVSGGSGGEDWLNAAGNSGAPEDRAPPWRTVPFEPPRPAERAGGWMRRRTSSDDSLHCALHASLVASLETGAAGVAAETDGEAAAVAGPTGAGGFAAGAAGFTAGSAGFGAGGQACGGVGVASYDPFPFARRDRLPDPVPASSAKKDGENIFVTSVSFNQDGSRFAAATTAGVRLFACGRAGPAAAAGSGGGLVRELGRYERATPAPAGCGDARHLTATWPGPGKDSQPSCTAGGGGSGEFLSQTGDGAGGELQPALPGRGEPAFLRTGIGRRPDTLASGSGASGGSESHAAAAAGGGVLVAQLLFATGLLAMVTAAQPCVLQLWESRTNRLLERGVRCDGPILRVLVHREVLVLVTESAVYLYDAASLAPLRVMPTGANRLGVAAVSTSLEAPFVVACPAVTPGAVRLMFAAEFAAPRTPDAPPPVVIVSPHKRAVGCIALAPDGMLLASVEADEAAARGAGNAARSAGKASGGGVAAGSAFAGTSAGFAGISAGAAFASGSAGSGFGSSFSVARLSPGGRSVSVKISSCRTGQVLHTLRWPSAGRGAVVTSLAFAGRGEGASSANAGRGLLLAVGVACAGPSGDAVAVFRVHAGADGCSGSAGGGGAPRPAAGHSRAAAGSLLPPPRALFTAAWRQGHELLRGTIKNMLPRLSAGMMPRVPNYLLDAKAELILEAKLSGDGMDVRPEPWTGRSLFPGPSCAFTNEACLSVLHPSGFFFQTEIPPSAAPKRLAPPAIAKELWFAPRPNFTLADSDALSFVLPVIPAGAAEIDFAAPWQATKVRALEGRPLDLFQPPVGEREALLAAASTTNSIDALQAGLSTLLAVTTTAAPAEAIDFCQYSSQSDRSDHLGDDC